MIGFCSNQRTYSENSGICCSTCHIHYVFLNRCAVVALENIDGVVVGLEIVGVYDGVAAKHDIIIKSDVNRFELLIFKSTIFNKHIFIEQCHVLSLQIKSNASVDELTAYKLSVVVNNAVAIVHVDEVFVVVR